MADVKTPRAGRSQSSSRLVTVAASQKQKPKNAPFKFLRKDEGRLSYTCQPESPLSGSHPTPTNNNNNNNHNNSREGPYMERRGSRSLREAIANDMRRGKNQDPFETVIIAVPKRAPPPNSAARDESQHSNDVTQSSERRSHPSQHQQQHQQHIMKRPEWVDPEIPEPNGDLKSTAKPQRSLSPEEQDRAMDSVGQRFNTGQGYGSSRLEEDDDLRADSEWTQSKQRRWRNDDLDNGVSRRTGPRRYADPVDMDDEYSSRSNRNFFRRPQRQDYRPTREEDDLVEQLKDELHAAREERERYHQLKQQLDREKQRFEEYRTGVEQEIEDERAELDEVRASEQWQAKKDVRAIEERYKSTLELVKTERESNKKLTQENEHLRQQLESITTRMRETQKLQKAESSRLRREIDSLTRRNEELLDMVKEHQSAVLESGNRIQPQVASSLLQIGQNSRIQVPSSVSSARHSSVDTRELSSDRPMIGGSVPQVQRVDEVENRLRVEAEEKERKRIEIEERRRAEIEERRRVDAEEKERKRIEIEERRRAEAEEKERKRIEIEERRRAEAEEKERKRIEIEERRRAEIEERRRVDAEEKERKRIEIEERRRAEAEEKERKRIEIEERRRAEAEEKERKHREELFRRQSEENEKEKSLSFSQTQDKEKEKEPRTQRRAGGHPVLTPRAQSTKAPPSTGGSLTSAPVKSASVSRRPRRTPTAAELIADEEPMPAEDFPSDAIVSQTALGENPNKREVLYRSGKREIHYANGTRKVILPSGHIVLYFTNGDIKRTFPSGKSTYWYAEAQTTHAQYPDGVEVFQFHSSGQIERHQPNVKKEILYPDGIYKVIFPDGRDETIFPDDL